MLRIVIWVLMIVGGSILSFFIDKQLFPFIQKDIVFHIFSFIIGLLLLFLVIKISRNTGKTLAKYGREGNLPRMNTNKFVDKSIYKYMRHPMHLGLLFFPLSIAFLLGSVSFIIIIAPIEIIFMLIMIKLVEEPEAIRKFGNAYIDYMKYTPWFCLKYECLKKLLSNNV
jgi:protein-S-isoprenylcysteine O-methyltransferase Ste14